MDAPWKWLTLLEACWVVGVTVWILLEGRSPRATIAWILGLSLLPVVGVLLYFVFGPRRFDRKRLRMSRAQRAVRGATAGEGRTGPGPELSPRAAPLIRLCEGAGDVAALARPGAVAFFHDGRACFDALEEAIGAARHHVHLEFYIYEPDRFGTRLRDLLARKAAEGVEVRLLVDAFGASAATDRFFRPLRAAGARVERFNALTLSRWRRRLANFRTHRKIVVCDGTVGFVGGMNVSEVHTAELVGEAAWRDSHLRLEGPAVRGLQLVFCEDWHYATGAAPLGPAYFPRPLDAPPDAKLVQVVSSGPDESADAIHKLFFSSIAAAEERVFLTSAYFVPDEPLLDALATASLRGADVRILVPRGGDVPLVEAAARSYYPALLEVGARIFEYGPPVLHAKTLVVDEHLAVVGTANMDNRSFRLNFEVVAAVYDAEAAASLAGVFESDLARAREVTPEQLASLSLPRRLGDAVARLLSPIL